MSAAAALAWVPRPAAADDDYRTTLIAIDTAAFATMGAGGLLFRCSDRDGDNACLGNWIAAGTLTVIAAASYTLAAPIIHLREDHPIRALASLGVRAGGPLLGHQIGKAIWGESNLVAVGIAAGFVAAVVVDWTVIAVDRQGPDAQARVVSLSARF